MKKLILPILCLISSTGSVALGGQAEAQRAADKAKAEIEEYAAPGLGKEQIANPFTTIHLKDSYDTVLSSVAEIKAYLNEVKSSKEEGSEKLEALEREIDFAKLALTAMQSSLSVLNLEIKSHIGLINRCNKVDYFAASHYSLKSLDSLNLLREVGYSMLPGWVKTIAAEELKAEEGKQ